MSRFGRSSSAKSAYDGNDSDEDDFEDFRRTMSDLIARQDGDIEPEPEDEPDLEAGAEDPIQEGSPMIQTGVDLLRDSQPAAPERTTSSGFGDNIWAGLKRPSMLSVEASASEDYKASLSPRASPRSPLKSPRGSWGSGLLGSPKSPRDDKEWVDDPPLCYVTRLPGATAVGACATVVCVVLFIAFVGYFLYEDCPGYSGNVWQATDSEVRCSERR